MDRLFKLLTGILNQREATERHFWCIRLGGLLPPFHVPAGLQQPPPVTCNPLGCLLMPGRTTATANLSTAPLFSHRRHRQNSLVGPYNLFCHVYLHGATGTATTCLCHFPRDRRAWQLYSFPGRRTEPWDSPALVQATTSP